MAIGTATLGIVPIGTALGGRARPFVQGLVSISVVGSSVGLAVSGSDVALAVESAAAELDVT